MIDIAKPQYTLNGHLIENFQSVKEGFVGLVQGTRYCWDANGRVRFASDDLDIVVHSPELEFDTAEDLYDAVAEVRRQGAEPVTIDRIWQQSHREEVVRQRFDTGTWRVTELCQVVADEPVFELPLAHIDLGSYNLDGDPGGLIAFARHMKHVLDADLSVPIILDEWGGILDGRHRIVKALVEGRPFILAKRVPAGTRPTERP